MAVLANPKIVLPLERLPPHANYVKAHLRFQREAVLLQELLRSRAQALDLPAVNYDEAGFRFALNEDAMATDKLAEGIRAFAVDARKLDALLLAA